MAFHGAHLAERGGVVAHCECVAIDSPGREAAALDLERIFAHPLAPPTQDGFPAMGREGRVVLISGGLPDGHLATGSYVGEKEILVIGLSLRNDSTSCSASSESTVIAAERKGRVGRAARESDTPSLSVG